MESQFSNMRVSKEGVDVRDIEEVEGGVTKILDSEEWIPTAPKEVKPSVGKEFISEEDAYTFYNEYGRLCGFGIRKCQIRKLKSGEVASRILRCSAAGARSDKWLEITNRKRKAKPITRCDCPARIIVNKIKGEEKWVVTKFDEKHSHKLMTPNKSCFIRSHRYVPDTHLDIMQGFREVGVSVSRTLNFFSTEAGGREALGYGEKDLHNAIQKRRSETHGKSVQMLLSLFQQKVFDDSNFTYEIQMDEDSRLMSCFWVDNISKDDYVAFGDVVCFDTTYKTNQFDMPFGPFVGVNHHKQTILLGAGLLFGETVQDFKWLFQTWIQAMGGRASKVIITDQDPAMANAIAQVFPHTVHRLCMWHITQKLPERLAYTFHSKPNFMSVWTSCVNKCEEIDEFEASWAKMRKDYELEENPWLDHMYNIREMWIPAYLKNNFMAGMATTQRSESVNAMFDFFVTHRSSLVEFAHGYDKALEKRRHDELRADYETSIGKPVLTTLYAMEAQMSEIYTKEIFNDFHKELMHSMYYETKCIETDGAVDRYILSCHLDANPRTVVWDKEKQMAFCPCRGFEFCGIPCKHILAVLKSAKVTHVPPTHILKRWTRGAKEKSKDAESSSVQSIENSPLVRRHILSRKWAFLIDEATKDLAAFKIAECSIDKAAKEILDLRAIEENVKSRVDGSNLNELVELHESDATNATNAGVEENDLNVSDTLTSPPFQANLLLDPHVVRTKGRGNKRLKPARELATAGRLCRGCNKVVVGHDKRTCPLYKEQVDESARGRGRGRGREVA